MLERGTPVNWSSLKWILHSPKHYRHYLDCPRTDTEALLRGRALHCAVYEPDEWKRRYVVMPKFHAGMNDDTAIAKGYEGGKQAKAEWEEDHAGAECLPADMYGQVVGMANALLGDAYAAALITEGQAEKQITWTDALTGIECSGRVDRIHSRLTDLKSTSDLLGFNRQIARYKYHGQLAFYSDGLEANGFEFEWPPALIAVESSPPYDVAVFTVGPDTLAAGRAMYRSALDTLAECRKLDRWPGIARGELRDVALPAWALDTEPDEEITVGGERLF